MNKKAPLSGTKNKRLYQTDLKNASFNFPLADTAAEQKAGLTTPAEEDVIQAKEWVDDGSLL